jgi:hypothetical protein
MTRLHLDVAKLFRGCLAEVLRSGHCDGCAGCFGSGVNSKVEPRNVGHQYIRSTRVDKCAKLLFIEFVMSQTPKGVG